MRDIGLEALDIFKHRKFIINEFPQLLKIDVDEKSRFNPNDTYLYFPSLDMGINQSTPFYCFPISFQKRKRLER